MIRLQNGAGLALTVEYPSVMEHCHTGSAGFRGSMGVTLVQHAAAHERDHYDDPLTPLRPLTMSGQVISRSRRVDWPKLPTWLTGFHKSCIRAA